MKRLTVEPRIHVLKSANSPRKWNSVNNTDAEKECKTNPHGRGYLGTTSVSSSGLPCQAWADVVAAGVLQAPLIPDSNGLDAQNYCRIIAGQGWTSPSCFVNIGGSNFKKIVNQTCSIPFCGEIDPMSVVFSFWYYGYLSTNLRCIVQASNVDFKCLL